MSRQKLNVKNENVELESAVSRDYFKHTNQVRAGNQPYLSILADLTILFSSNSGDQQENLTLISICRVVFSCVPSLTLKNAIVQFLVLQ